eukprot:1022645-Lingulodinium_polyedra.AAC.1
MIEYLRAGANRSASERTHCSLIVRNATSASVYSCASACARGCACGRVCERVSAHRSSGAGA